jgi:hypothetical protein
MYHVFTRLLPRIFCSPQDSVQARRVAEAHALSMRVCTTCAAGEPDFDLAVAPVSHMSGGGGRDGRRP